MSVHFDSDFDNEILMVFLEEISGYLPEFEEHLAKLKANPKVKESLEECHRLAHTIKGSAASLGFSEVSKHGLALEQALTPVVEKKAVFTPELAQECERHLAAIRALLAQMQPTAVEAAEAPVTSLTEPAHQAPVTAATTAGPEPTTEAMEATPPPEVPLIPAVELAPAPTWSSSEVSAIESAAQAPATLPAKTEAQSGGAVDAAKLTFPTLPAAGPASTNFTQAEPGMIEERFTLSSGRAVQTTPMSNAGAANAVDPLFADIFAGENLPSFSQAGSNQVTTAPSTPKRGWLEEAAELFSFDDIHPLDFARKIEQQNATPVETSEVKDTTPAYELPDWLREAQTGNTEPAYPPETAALPQTPLLNTAGVRESDASAPEVLELPTFGDLDLGLELASPENKTQTTATSDQSLTTPVDVPDFSDLGDFDFNFEQPLLAPELQVTSSDWSGLDDIFSTSEIDRHIERLQQEILPEIPSDLTQFEAVPLPSEIGVSDSDLLSRLTPPIPASQRLPAIDQGNVPSSFDFSPEDLADLQDVEALLNNLEPVVETTTPSYTLAEQLLAESGQLDLPELPQLARLEEDKAGELVSPVIESEREVEANQLEAAVEAENSFVPSTYAEDAAAINAALAELPDLEELPSPNGLADLPGLENLTPEEVAMLAESGLDFSNFGDDADGFGFDAAPMWLAEGQADLDEMRKWLDSQETSNASKIQQSSATLRKAAELMDLTEIANQLSVIETMAGMLVSGDLPQNPNSFAMLKNAYQDLEHLLKPYHAAADAILNPQVATTLPEAEVAASEVAYPAATVTENEETATAVAIPVFNPTPVGVEVDKELAEVFASEAEEHIQNLDSRLAALEKDPGNRELVREIRRTAHTLKGSAAMVGFHVVSHTAHLMEDLLDKLFDGSLEVTPPIVELLFATFNVIDKLVRDLIAARPEDPALLEELRPRYEAMLETPEAEATGGAIIFERKTPISIAIPAIDAPVVELPPETLETASSLSIASLDTELAVRIPIGRLDGMMNQVGELVINRTVLEQRNQVFNRAVEELSLSIRRLQRISRELETRYEVELLKNSSVLSPGVGAGSGNGSRYGNGNGNGNSNGSRYGNGNSSYNNYSALPDPLKTNAEFDTLEMDRYTEFHTLSREMSETVSDIATVQRELDTVRDDLDNISVQQSRLTDDLQDRLVKVRLVSLSNLTPRLYRAVRTLSVTESKDVEFVVSGDSTQVDKTIFEEIGDPLLHLIRNAIDHGVELPDERRANHKNPVATVGFAARSEGSDVVIEVSDDGRGIDLEGLKRRGIERGFLSPDANPNEEELYNLMFQPGFSTSITISEVSGRGVGLDVVRSNITRLKGVIEVASQPGKGTTFIIRLPNTLAISRALLTKAGGYTYAIPLNAIEETTRLEPNALLPSSAKYGRGSYYRYNGETLPLYDLSALLRLSAHARKQAEVEVDEEEANATAKRDRPLLIMNGAQRYALTIDKLEGQQEVVVKGLGSHLKSVRGVIGATILGSGQVILILNVYELLDRNLRQTGVFAPRGVRRGELTNLEAARTLSEAEIKEREQADLRNRVLNGETRQVVPPLPKARRTPLIQVVDDSLSIRKVLSNALEKAGFRVRTSKDGQEALETIRQGTPDLIIMDIEMPRMDGYQLTSILKGDESFQHIPIVMLTSRAGLKHRQKAEEVGADGFLVKPYKEEELLDMVSTLLVLSSQD